MVPVSVSGGVPIQELFYVTLPQKHPCGALRWPPGPSRILTSIRTVACL